MAFTSAIELYSAPVLPRLAKGLETLHQVVWANNVQRFVEEAGMRGPT